MTLVVGAKLRLKMVGRLDDYLENGQDVAYWLAGALLVREAGGVITELHGEPFGWSGEGIVAAGPQCS